MKLDAAATVERHPGITPGIAGAMVEAASVALARRYSPPRDFEITDGPRRDLASLRWPPPDARTTVAWLDKARTTEWGAELLAILAVERLRSSVVISRAPRGSRVDYYVGLPGQPLERATLLEIAGADADAIGPLLAKKLRQAARNPDRLPAIAAVVTFLEPRASIADAEPEPR